MSSLTSPKKVENAISSSEPESENWDKVSKVFFLSNLRCRLNSLSKGKEVHERRMASGGTGRETFEKEGFEGEFFEDIHWRIWGICWVAE